MDQEKIGRFIASCRKEQGLTQAALAEKLGITDRAVSKWETGRSMPDASIIQDLCGLLKININELFSGERLDMDQYKNMAEEHLMEFRKQEETANRRLLRLEIIIGIITIGAFIAMLPAGVYLVEKKETAIGIVLIVAAALILILGGCAMFKIEHDAGYYECPECGFRHVPTYKAIVFSSHFGLTKRLKCPNCGRRAYHKKVLTKEK
ncbi:MAG: helix-turn-helix transcriptional regulator [Lachnospiraceae bacterium]|nr:helix-turn-helix transcriptional regulator [Lachnospiraceae bacterium]